MEYNHNNRNMYFSIEGQDLVEQSQSKTNTATYTANAETNAERCKTPPLIPLVLLLVFQNPGVAVA